MWEYRTEAASEQVRPEPSEPAGPSLPSRSACLDAERCCRLSAAQSVLTVIAYLSRLSSSRRLSECALRDQLRL